jgi:ribosomal protein S18 acetylase RimI-like enzyme
MEKKSPVSDEEFERMHRHELELRKKVGSFSGSDRLSRDELYQERFSKHDVRPIIRPATSADHDAIWAILEPVIREGATYPLDPAIEREEAFHYWFAPDKRVFVTELDGEVLGTYYLKPNSTGLADHVANGGYMTHPNARGRGIASAMALDSFERAKAVGFAAMQFNLVVATNEAAVHLWQKLGMDVVGRLPKAFRHKTLGPVDALVMYRLL